jgi:hypothetical protein
MKRTVQLILLALISNAVSACAVGPVAPETSLRGQQWMPVYEDLLEKYVTPAGNVKYARWHREQEDLDRLREVVGAIARVEAPEDRDERLAFYLNAYNAWILWEILEKYPTKGPLAGNPAFFHVDRIQVAGQKMSFDHLEQKIIRPEFKEPRIHFAINCASVSCPKLHDEPFRGDRLDEQLEELTREFANSQHAARVTDNGGTVRLSKLFDWYGEDFQEAGGPVAYLNRYRTARKQLPTRAEVKFQEYNWSLNAAGS